MDRLEAIKFARGARNIYGNYSELGKFFWYVENELAKNNTCNGCSRLYVLDKQSGRIHRIGDDRHDSLTVMDGEIHYHNMQNGDGGTVIDREGYGYLILPTDSGGFESPILSYERSPYADQIRKYLEEEGIL